MTEENINPPILKEVTVEVGLSKNYQGIKVSETYMVPEDLDNADYEQYFDGISANLTDQAKQKLLNVLTAKAELDEELKNKELDPKPKKVAFGNK